MELNEGILIALVIVLVVYLLHSSRKSKAPPAPANDSARFVCANEDTGAISRVNVSSGEGYAASSAPSTYEDMTNDSMNENMEYFSACGAGTAQDMSVMCASDGSPSFAVNEFGAEGYSYQDYVASQAVDNAVIQNHAQFVSDRKGLGPEGELITGRTFSPDSHDSYDPIPWVGLRRPQYVQQCNPTQVPDVDTNLYKGNRQFCFST